MSLIIVLYKGYGIYIALVGLATECIYYIYMIQWTLAVNILFFKTFFSNSI